MCTPRPSSPAAAAWFAPFPPGAGEAGGPITPSPPRARREVGGAARPRPPPAGEPVDQDQHVLVQAADDGDGHEGPPGRRIVGHQQYQTQPCCAPGSGTAESTS